MKLFKLVIPESEPVFEDGVPFCNLVVVVLAESELEAITLLIRRLKENGLPYQFVPFVAPLKEVDLEKSGVVSFSWHS